MATSMELPRAVLENEFAKLELRMTARGIAREDGRTAADIEAEMAAATTREQEAD